MITETHTTLYKGYSIRTSRSEVEGWEPSTTFAALNPLGYKISTHDTMELAQARIDEILAEAAEEAAYDAAIEAAAGGRTGVTGVTFHGDGRYTDTYSDGTRIDREEW